MAKAPKVGALGEAQSAGNGMPFARTAPTVGALGDAHWPIWDTPVGPARKRSSAVLCCLELAMASPAVARLAANRFLTGCILRYIIEGVLVRHFYACLFLVGFSSTYPVLTLADEPVHLLGFVEQLCPDRPYCFELRVEPDFVISVGERITVHFGEDSTIFDPENYQLTLQQSNIIPGSHLRLLLIREPVGADIAYRARFIWIGD